MQAEADREAFLDSPEGAEALQILTMPRDEFKDEFADAYDEEDEIDADEDGA